MPSRWTTTLGTAAMAVALLAADGAATAAPPTLTCHLVPVGNHIVRGHVAFTPCPGNAGVRISAAISGLQPGSVHGWHIHEFGDVSTFSGSGTGGHFNPLGVPHGLPGGQARHVGDLGNLPPVDAGGHTRLDSHFCVASLHTDAIVGRGLVIHSRMDSGRGVSGEAGPRLAQCVLGIGKSPAPAAARGRRGAHGAAGRAGARAPRS